MVDREQRKKNLKLVLGALGFSAYFGVMIGMGMAGHNIVASAMFLFACALTSILIVLYGE